MTIYILPFCIKRPKYEAFVEAKLNQQLNCNVMHIQQALPRPVRSVPSNFTQKAALIFFAMFYFILKVVLFRLWSEVKTNMIWIIITATVKRMN